MNIVIIGSGNVAALLGRKFISAGHKIVQVAGRNIFAASALADEWKSSAIQDLHLLNQNADVYIIAVSDGAIADVADKIHLPGKIVAHTAASVKMNVLKNVTDNYGVFYPLQSLRKEMETDLIPIYIEASNKKTKIVLDGLAHSISGENVSFADYEKRLKLHVAAVIVNNFTNHIFALAEDYCKKEGLSFTELIPLINNTVSRLSHNSPTAMQTGPAVRGDRETIAKHKALLQNHPKLLQLYKFLTESILTEKLAVP